MSSISRKLLLVGLGNPGMDGTRHNVGMYAIDKLSSSLGAPFKPNKKLNAFVSQSRYEISLLRDDKTGKLVPVNKFPKFGQLPTGYSRSPVKYEIVCLKPKEFMNLNGKSVKKAATEFKVDVGSVVVFHDNMDQDLSKYKLKSGGSANGHNGVKSVISCLGSKNFERICIGIGRPSRDGPDGVLKHVLQKFSVQERSLVDDVAERIVNTWNDLLILPRELRADRPIEQPKKPTPTITPNPIPPTT